MVRVGARSERAQFGLSSVEICGSASERIVGSCGADAEVSCGIPRLQRNAGVGRMNCWCGLRRARWIAGAMGGLWIAARGDAVNCEL